MIRRALGATGLDVSALTLGTSNFGRQTAPDDAAAIVRHAVDAGITTIDTANKYQRGGSEEILGRALAGIRDQVVLATKVGARMEPGREGRGLSRAAVLRQCEGSLRRLGTDWIDLYQLHRPDPAAGIDETLGALDELVAAGKVRHVGTSTFSAVALHEARESAARTGAVAPATEQLPYNLLERQIERHVLPACAELGLGVLAYSPLAGGLLADRYLGGNRPPGTRASRWDLDHERWTGALDAVERLGRLALEAGTRLSHLALAWARDAPGIATAIIGPSSIDQLDDAIAAGNLVLDRPLREAIDAIVAPGSGRWLSAKEDDSAAREQVGPAGPTAT